MEIAMSKIRYVLFKIDRVDGIEEKYIEAIFEFDIKNRRKDGRYINGIQKEIDKMEEKVINDGYEIRIERLEQLNKLTDEKILDKKDFTIFFHLAENKNDTDRPYAFIATFVNSQEHEAKQLPLKYALKIFEDNKDDESLRSLLAIIHLAEQKSDLISELLETGELFHPLAWTKAKADQFIKEIQIFTDLGIICKIPDHY